VPRRSHINSCWSTLPCTKHIVPVTLSHRTPHQRARFTDSSHRLDELLEPRLPSLLTLATIKAYLMIAVPEAGSESIPARMLNATYLRTGLRNHSTVFACLKAVRGLTTAHHAPHLRTSSASSEEAPQQNSRAPSAITFSPE
jgi:hypothetical protein